MLILSISQCQQIIDLAVKRLAEYLQEYQLAGFTCGVSGGIDSSVVAVIATKTIEYLKESGVETTADFYFLDCDSDDSDYQCAQNLAKQFNFDLKKLDLTGWYQASPLLQLIPKDHPRAAIAKGNIKARLRMLALYHFTQLKRTIYLDTDDLSEELMGFWTRHGDEGDVKIIQNLTKTELYDLGEFLQFSKIILDAKPSDGLKVTANNLAKDQLGLDYLYIEYILSRFSGEGLNYNGSGQQLQQDKYQTLINQTAQEIKQSEQAVKQVLEQSLQTAYKRKFGDNVKSLLPNRAELGLPRLGSKEFDQLYLKAIEKLF